MNQQRGNRVRQKPRRISIELLEPRQLLAATPLPPFDPAFGYTAAQMRHAYGFDKVTFNHGTVPGDGRGQTIAIVDAFDNPTIVTDLGIFDMQMGLPAPPSFRIVNQTGGTNLPQPDAGWAGEIALDVEWSHAIAPMANILLVEANTPAMTDLYAAVDYARNQPAVSVVSMSFGGSEFFLFNAGGANQLDFDSHLHTPPGHQGITFVASAGDSSNLSGVQFPSASPYVLSVGGTSLNFSDPSGTYANETYWTGTNSGYSNLEPEPIYQTGVQDTGFRSSPDVSYNADNTTGVAVYSDFAFGGWFPTGGTSCGAPQWAGLLAIANQGRVLNGLGTLDGPTQTLPILYSLYAPPGSPAYSTYTSYFNDIIQTGSPGPGFNNGIPVAGFDTDTGLGSPKAQNLIPALAMLSAPPPSTIVATVVGPPPATARGGDVQTLKLSVTNTASYIFDGPVSVNLFASPTTGTPAEMPVGTISLGMLRLKPGKPKVMKVKYDYPFSLGSGSFHLSGAIFTPTSNTVPAPVTIPTTVTVAQPTVDLAITPGTTIPVLVKPGTTAVASVVITNVGNFTADGFVNLTFYASPHRTIDSAAVMLPPVGGHKIRLKPGHSIKLRVPFYAPLDMAGGTYNILAAISSATTPADTNAANNVAVISTRAS